MRGPDGDVARYRQIVPPVLSTVLTLVIMPVADFAAAIRVADFGIPKIMNSKSEMYGTGSCKTRFLRGKEGIWHMGTDRL